MGSRALVVSVAALALGAAPAGAAPSFGAPIAVLSGTGATQSGFDVDVQGSRILVGWTSGKSVVVRRGTVTGGFGPAKIVFTGRTEPSDLTVAVSPSGRAALAWSFDDGATTQIAVAGSTGAFRVIGKLSALGVELYATGSRFVVVGNTTGFPVKTVYAVTGARLSTVRNAPVATDHVAKVAVGTDGSLTMAWPVDRDTGPRWVSATLTAHGTRFGPTHSLLLPTVPSGPVSAQVTTEMARLRRLAGAIASPPLAIRSTVLTSGENSDDTALAIPQRGAPLAAWEPVPGSGTEIQALTAASVDAAGHLTGQTTLAPQVDDFDMAASKSDAVIAWADAKPQGDSSVVTGLRYAVRTASGALSKPAVLAAGSQNGFVQLLSSPAGVVAAWGTEARGIRVAILHDGG